MEAAPLLCGALRSSRVEPTRAGKRLTWACEPQEPAKVRNRSRDGSLICRQRARGLRERKNLHALPENTGFAKRCLEEGIAFIRPVFNPDCVISPDEISRAALDATGSRSPPRDHYSQ